MLEITCCAICVWVGNGATSFDIDHPGSIAATCYIMLGYSNSIPQQVLGARHTGQHIKM